MDRGPFPRVRTAASMERLRQASSRMKSSEPLILYQDDDLIAVDKPSGMIVYPDGKHDYPALDAFLKEKFGELFFPHRIDRETSGVLVVARTERAFENLKKQFQRREVQKTYRAFLYGALTEERGSIDRPIGSPPPRP